MLLFVSHMIFNCTVQFNISSYLILHLCAFFFFFLIKCLAFFDLWIWFHCCSWESPIWSVCMLRGKRSCLETEVKFKVNRKHLVTFWTWFEADWHCLNIIEKTERWKEETESCNLFIFIEKRLTELLVDRSARELGFFFSAKREMLDDGWNTGSLWKTK